MAADGTETLVGRRHRFPGTWRGGFGYSRAEGGHHRSDAVGHDGRPGGSASAPDCGEPFQPCLRHGIVPGSAHPSVHASVCNVLPGLDVPDGNAMPLRPEPFELFGGDGGLAPRIVQAGADVAPELQDELRSLLRRCFHGAGVADGSARSLPWNDYSLGFGRAMIDRRLSGSTAGARGPTPCPIRETPSDPDPANWSALSTSFSGILNPGGWMPYLANASRTNRPPSPCGRWRTARRWTRSAGEWACPSRLVSRWKKQFVGMGVPEIRRLKQPEDENSKLKRLVADLTLDRSMRAEMCSRISGEARRSPRGRRSPAGGLRHQRASGLPGHRLWAFVPALREALRPAGGASDAAEGARCRTGADSRAGTELPEGNRSAVSPSG